MSGNLEIKVKPVGERSCVLKSVRSSAEHIELPGYCDGRYITEIGRGAFKKCHTLKSLTIPESVKRMAAKAFCGSDIERIVVPKTVEFIGKHAFHNCVYLNCVVIENARAAIGAHLFSGCYCIKRAIVPTSALDSEWLSNVEEITIIGDDCIQSRMFEDCKKLKTVVIDEGIEDIYEHAFDGCAALSELSLPNTLKSIEEWAFNGCASLKAFTLPCGVTELDLDALSGNSFVELTVADGNPVYHGKGNCIIETATKKLVAGCANSFIPSDGSVTVIGECAFSDCKALTGIEIPESVITIEDNAFANCEELVSIVLPEGVEEVCDFVFDGCKKLESIVFPSSLKKLGFGVIDACEWLEDIIFNGTVAEWASVEKDHSWNFSDMEVVHCKDGDAEI